MIERHSPFSKWGMTSGPHPGVGRLKVGVGRLKMIVVYIRNYRTLSSVTITRSPTGKSIQRSLSIPVSMQEAEEFSQLEDSAPVTDLKRCRSMTLESTVAVVS